MQTGVPGCILTTFSLSWSVPPNLTNCAWKKKWFYFTVIRGSSRQSLSAIIGFEVETNVWSMLPSFCFPLMFNCDWRTVKTSYTVLSHKSVKYDACYCLRDTRFYLPAMLLGIYQLSKSLLLVPKLQCNQLRSAVRGIYLSVCHLKTLGNPHQRT